MTDHAHELRRHAKKIGHPAGDTPAVMHSAAAHIEDLVRRLREAEKDAWRYRKLRDEDEWGEDVALGGGSAWEMLGKLHGSNFDKFVDAWFQPPKNGD